MGFSFGVFVFLAGLQMPPLPRRQVVALVLHCAPVLYSLSLLQYKYIFFMLLLQDRLLCIHQGLLVPGCVE